APMSMEENTDYLDFCNGKFCNSIPSHHDYAEGNIVGKLSQLFLLEPNELLIYPLSQRERNEILDLLLRYYRFHLPSFPTLKCVEVLRELYG
ncbi:MAG TPA: hypothetical protein DDY68_02665, partial [Porphyromonadaceae bacterium]|nr:hypothetical protein [Porphyromonadaceae bacterium]